MNRFHIHLCFFFYRDYTTSLAYDIAQTRQKYAFSDHSDLVARRMGFIPLPLSVVVVRVLVQAVNINNAASAIIILVAILSLGTFKILNNILILGFASGYMNRHEQERASGHSPSGVRAGSPMNVPLKSKECLKDTTTNPLKPIINPPSTSPVFNVNCADNLSDRDLASDRINDLGPSVLFCNSTVDLKNVTLNEELLKVEDNDIKIENLALDDFTR